MELFERRYLKDIIYFLKFEDIDSKETIQLSFAIKGRGLMNII